MKTALLFIELSHTCLYPVIGKKKDVRLVCVG